MNKLVVAVEEIIRVKGYDWKKIAKTSSQYIEVLSISDPKEIKEMISIVYETHYMECPFWVKLIAFKILLLHNSKDEEVKQWLMADAQMFGGPDWEEKVKSW